MRRILAAIGGAALLLPAAWAGEDEANLERAMKQLHELVRQAEELQAAGRHDEAEKVRAKAQALKAEIHLHMVAQHKAKEGGGDRDGHQRELREILQGLEHGMVALKRLGRPDDVERLGKVAEDVRRQLREHEGHDRKHDEGRKDLGNRLEVTMVAVKALAEAGRERDVDVLERAVRGLRMDFEGRRDEESNRWRRESPGVEDQIELLRLASRILAEQGKPDRSEMVAKLAEELTSREHAKGKRRAEERHVVVVERHAEARAAEHADVRAVSERLERLEQRVERLLNASRR